MRCPKFLHIFVASLLWERHPARRPAEAGHRTDPDCSQQARGLLRNKTRGHKSLWFEAGEGHGHPRGTPQALAPYRRGLALWRGGIRSCFDVTNTKHPLGAFVQKTRHNGEQDTQSAALAVPEGWLAEDRIRGGGRPRRGAPRAQTGRQGSTQHAAVSPGSTRAEVRSTEGRDEKGRDGGCASGGVPDMRPWTRIGPTKQPTRPRDGKLRKRDALPHSVSQYTLFAETKRQTPERKFPQKSNWNKFICRRRTSEHQVQSDPQRSNNSRASCREHGRVGGDIGWTLSESQRTSVTRCVVTMTQE